MSMMFGTAEEIESITYLHNNTKEATEAETEKLTNSIFTVLVTAAIIATYNSVVFNIIKTVYWEHYSYNRQEFRKVAYQITNLTVNGCLGIYGLYHYIFSVAPMHTVSIAERIAGFPEFSTFGALQVGYNVWALPIGFFFMNESKAMVTHHCAVLCVGSISCFSGNGFRYHAPFFFGAIEISSVPLAIMNFCKDNKELSDKHCPKLAGIVRPVFALSFLVVRVFMWTPLMADVLRIVAILGRTCETVGCAVGKSSFWLSAFFLSLLQYFWASMIVKGIINMLTGKGKKDKTA